jgi:hypothetical protein
MSQVSDMQFFSKAIKQHGATMKKSAHRYFLRIFLAAKNVKNTFCAVQVCAYFSQIDC